MKTDYELAGRQFTGLVSGETDRLAISANFVALVDNLLEDINWVGLYVLRGGELVLGPFQGLPACTHIPLGQGVCGTAAANRQTQRVEDVHAFDGHIACDPASKSELVVPLVSGNELLGVLDIDSPLPARFGTDDQAGVEALCGLFVAALERCRPAAAGFI